MNSLMGFDDWGGVIEVPDIQAGRRGVDALYISERIWDNMKITGFSGIYRITNIRQDNGHPEENRETCDTKLHDYSPRMPLQVTLVTRRGKGNGSSYIDVILQGFATDPDGFSVIKIDCPDFKTEHHTAKSKEAK